MSNQSNHYVEMDFLSFSYNFVTNAECQLHSFKFCNDAELTSIKITITVSPTFKLTKDFFS